MKIKQMTLCALFTCLIVIGAFIKIPTPFAAITLQLPVVILSAVLLKDKGSFVCSCLYLIMGLSGIPVFSYGGGISYILQPTFGYILGFLPCTFITGYLCKKMYENKRRCFFAGLTGILTVHVTGFVYYILISRFYLKTEIDITDLIISLCLVALPKDIALCAVISAMGTRLHKALKL